MKTTSKNKGNGIDADVSGNRLPFKSQSINNFCGIDISQPTPSESLSVPLFSLGDDPIQKVKASKSVGVYIDEHLSCSNHVDS